MEKKLDGEYNGHAYVDMGFSVKWATCNVGAGSPEEYGDYYAWGETEPKSNYTKGNCKTMRECIGDIGGTSMDVAHVKWGGSWRMPTREEFEELNDDSNCTWEWTTRNGVNGYQVTSKKTGNHIFFPAAGLYIEAPSDVGYFAHYRSSTPEPGEYLYVYELQFWGGGRHSSYYRGVNCERRWGGKSVRPVTE